MTTLRESIDMLKEPACSKHPDAPHGFNRNSSHTAGRYVCDCEGWTPDDPASEQEALIAELADAERSIDELKAMIGRLAVALQAAVPQEAIGLAIEHHMADFPSNCKNAAVEVVHAVLAHLINEAMLDKKAALC